MGALTGRRLRLSGERTARWQKRTIAVTTRGNLMHRDTGSLER
jgi:hypothetical protein